MVLSPGIYLPYHPGYTHPLYLPGHMYVGATQVGRRGGPGLNLEINMKKGGLEASQDPKSVTQRGRTLRSVTPLLRRERMERLDRHRVNLSNSLW